MFVARSALADVIIGVLATKFNVWTVMAEVEAVAKFFAGAVAAKVEIRTKFFARVTSLLPSTGL